MGISTTARSSRKWRATLKSRRQKPTDQVCTPLILNIALISDDFVTRVQDTEAVSESLSLSQCFLPHPGLLALARQRRRRRTRSSQPRQSRRSSSDDDLEVPAVEPLGALQGHRHRCAVRCSCWRNHGSRLYPSLCAVDSSLTL